jgi:hypothetical protein
MTSNTLVLPALAQILLTVAMYARLAIAKARAVRAGSVDLERRALHDDAWPDSVVKINNNIRNQFEVPVLFYVLTIFLWQLNAAGAVAQSLAWAFVASRFVHAFVHTGSNYVPARRRIFMFGCVVVAAMAGLTSWAVFQA